MSDRCEEMHPASSKPSQCERVKGHPGEHVASSWHGKVVVYPSKWIDDDRNVHPYQCDGPGKCPHCDRRVIVATGDEGTSHYAHHPNDCGLCDPDYDGLPAYEKAGA